MKEITVLLLSCLLFNLSGYGQKYSIYGTCSDDSLNGKYLILTRAYFITEKPVIIDSVKVKNRKFSFKGRVNGEPFLASLYAGSSFLGSCIMEPGKIDISFRDTILNPYLPKQYLFDVSGTPLNDEYHREMILPSRMVAIADSLGARRHDVFRKGGVWTDDDELNFQRAFPLALAKESNDRRWKYLENHVQYPEIVFRFLSGFGYMGAEAERVQQISAQLPEETRQRIQRHNDSMQIKMERLMEKIKEGKVTLPKVTHVEQLPEAVQVGQPFIDFTGETLDGKSVSLSEIVQNNKLVMLDFWASWCAPCMQSMPELVDIYKEYKEKGLEIIGISSDENAQRWKNAIQKNGMNWLQIRSAGEDRIGQDYVIKFIPYTILIGQDGKIIARHLKGDELREKIQEVLK